MIKLSSLAIVTYLLISVFLLFLFFENILVWLSFLANWGILTIIFLYHIRIEKDFSPFLSSYITFNYLFLFLAPMVQISNMNNNNGLFPNYFPYSEGIVVFANGLICLFHSFFFISYLWFKKTTFKNRPKEQFKKSKYVPLTILILFFISLITLFFSYDYIITSITESHWRSELLFKMSVSSQLILKKVLYMLPLGALVLAHNYLKNKTLTKNTVIIFFLAFFLLLLLLFFKNPLTEKRNAIGPIYITLLFLFYPKLLNSNIKSFLFLFLSLVVFFPLASGLTHLDATLGEIINNPSIILKTYEIGGIVNSFTAMHYDAFSNILATIGYTIDNGFSNGYQLISGLLFFIPRSVWASKSNSSGEFIGDYLIENHNFFFNNLSNPLVSEGYINFGVFGVILLSICLAFFVVKFLVWLSSDNPLKRIVSFYFAVHLIFLLRGDFTNGFSYFIGTLIAILLIPYLMDLFFKWAFKKQ
ncbi:MAG: O-antigen polysaccharide polymerase Wzy [Flavobacteriaceae bacterium]